MEDLLIGDIVEVKWSDIQMLNGWNEFHHGAGPEKCTTVGYLAGYDQECVSIAQTRPEDAAQIDKDYWGNLISIPKGTVSDVRKLG